MRTTALKYAIHAFHCTTSSHVLLFTFRASAVMTLLDVAGLYVGWDQGGIPHMDLRIYCGSIQLQFGLLLLGCDWFFDETCARIKQSTLQREDR